MKPVQRILLWVIIIVGFWLRLYPFEEKSLWLDEALEYRVAHRPVAEVILADRNMTYDPPLLSLLLSLWMKGGLHDLYLRMLPISFSTLTIAAVFALAKRHFTPWIGVLAALIVAIAPRAVYYGQEINQYALTPLWAVSCLLALETFLRRPSKKSMAWFLLAGMLAFFTHYQLAFFLMALAIVGTPYVFVQYKWRERLTWIGGLTLVGIVGALLVWFYALPQKTRFPAAISPLRYTTWQISPLDEVKLWGEQTVEIVGFFFWGHRPTDLKWLPVGLLLLGLVVGLIQVRSRRLSLYLLAGSWISYLASGFGFFVYAHRYLWYLFPLCVVLMIAGLLPPLKARLAPLYLAGILAAGLLLGLLVAHLPVVSGVPDEEVEQFSPVVKYVQAQRQRDDRIYVYHGAGMQFRIYATDEMLQTAVIEPWPRNISDEEKWDQLWDVAAGQPRVWVLFTHVKEGDEHFLVSELTARCRQLDAIQKIRAAGYLFNCSGSD